MRNWGKGKCTNKENGVSNVKTETSDAVVTSHQSPRYRWLKISNKQKLLGGKVLLPKLLRIYEKSEEMSRQHRTTS